VKRSPPDSRTRLRRAALNALRRAKRAAEKAGVALTEWEGEFLTSVETRVSTFGRAFADPEKGTPGATLSHLQGVKLREIAVKARGGSASRPGPWRRSRPLSPKPGRGP
jgi:hypothetical protein